MTATLALDRLRAVGPLFRSGEAVAAGVSWRDLYRLRDEGEIVELSRGLYQLRESAGVDCIDFISVSARVPRAMICMVSALAYWDLTDENPSGVHLAIPRGTHRPVIDYPPSVIHVFAPETFEIGRIELCQRESERFSITSRERSIVDAFRLRHLVGSELAHEALRRYLRSQPQLPELSAMGRALRAGKAFADSIRLLLA